MSAKLIYCEDCQLYLGVIRDASLLCNKAENRDGIVYLCVPCDKKRKADRGADMFNALFRG